MTQPNELIAALLLELDQIVSDGGDFNLVGERIRRWKKRVVSALRNSDFGPEADEFEELEPGSSQTGDPEGNRARRIDLYRVHLQALAEDLERHPRQAAALGGLPGSRSDARSEGPATIEKRVGAIGPRSETISNRRDFFICHATEDKDEVARPIAEALVQAGHSVWFDEFELVPGDSLHKTIDQGLGDATVGVVILSQSFFSKDWPQRELGGLVSQGKRLCPIWRGMTQKQVAAYSPTLADVFALKSTDGVAKIVEGLLRSLAKAGPHFESAKLTPRAGRVHEREIDILSEVWRKLKAAEGATFQIVSPFSQHSDYDRMPDELLKEAIAKLPLAEFHKREILEARNKNEVYGRLMAFKKSNDAANATIELNNCVLDNAPFLTEELKSRLERVVTALRSTAITDQIGRQAQEQGASFTHEFKEWDKVGPLVREIEQLVRGRLGLS